MDEETQAISDQVFDRIIKGEYKQKIMTHQHFYQVQVSDKAIVRWCTTCGVTHLLWWTGTTWTERWTKIWDEREEQPMDVYQAALLEFMVYANRIEEGSGGAEKPSLVFYSDGAGMIEDLVSKKEYLEFDDISDLWNKLQ